MRSPAAWLVVASYLLLQLACGGTSRGAEANSETAEPVVSRTEEDLQPPVMEAAAGEANAVAAQPEAQPEPEPEREPEPSQQMIEDMGFAAADLVEAATQVEIGRMRVIGADQAVQRRLSGDRVIAGYPVRGRLTSVDEPTANELKRVLLDDESYRWGLLRRCRNDSFVGVRFSRGERRVEFALGMPCEQGRWVLRTANGIASPGAIMTESAAQVVVDALP